MEYDERRRRSSTLGGLWRLPSEEPAEKTAIATGLAFLHPRFDAVEDLLHLPTSRFTVLDEASASVSVLRIRLRHRRLRRGI
jgi:hypothetical protein